MFFFSYLELKLNFDMVNTPSLFYSALQLLFWELSEPFFLESPIFTLAHYLFFPLTFPECCCSLESSLSPPEKSESSFQASEKQPLQLNSTLSEITDAMKGPNDGLAFFNKTPGLPQLTFIGKSSYSNLCLRVNWAFSFNRPNFLEACLGLLKEGLNWAHKFILEEKPWNHPIVIFLISLYW